MKDKLSSVLQRVDNCYKTLCNMYLAGQDTFAVAEFIAKDECCEFLLLQPYISEHIKIILIY